MKVHKLKILYKYWCDIVENKKTHEIRFNDRDYKVGDLLDFVVLKGNTVFYSVCYYEITHILSSKDFPIGLKNGYCILSIKKLKGVWK